MKDNRTSEIYLDKHIKSKKCIIEEIHTDVSMLDTIFRIAYFSDDLGAWIWFSKRFKTLDKAKKYVDNFLLAKPKRIKHLMKPIAYPY